MLKITRCAAVVLMCLPILAYGEITLDENFPWDAGLDPAKTLLKHGDPVADVIEHDLLARGFDKGFYWGGIFRMQWTGLTYYATVVQYQSKEQTASIDHGVAMHKQFPPIPGGGVCSLFISDASLFHFAQYDIKLPEAGGRTWCNGTDGLGRVKGQDALLVPVSYYLTDKKLAKKIKDIGDGWRHITVLLRLKQQNGRVVIEQDDSCLGNPNHFPDIPSARKALQKCGN